MQILIVHGYRGPITGGAYWLPNTTHEVSDTDAQYLIDNGHARPVAPIVRSAPQAPVEALPDEPEAEPERPRTRRGGKR